MCLVRPSFGFPYAVICTEVKAHQIAKSMGLILLTIVLTAVRLSASSLKFKA